MVDILKAKNEFMEYVNNYNIEDENINRKVYHSYRVMDISKKIAEELNLSENEKKLAELIGLLHDIGRFEQFTKYKTFRDVDSIDHSEFGVKILLEKNYIRKFVKDSKYDNLIIKAIYNHNKFKIEENLNEEEKLFCKIIRDADKIDILYEAINIFFTDDEDEINKGIISDRVYDAILKLKPIKREKGVKLEKVDKVVSYIALIFDINFSESLNIIKENDYINKILDKFDFKNIETKEKIEEIRRISNNYIDKRLSKG